MEISCREVRKELANYMENDIDDELRTRIERHFRECDGCNALYDSIRKIVRLVGSRAAGWFQPQTLLAVVF
jgi:predicted anti-sigma-YlaC factor YlaD